MRRIGTVVRTAQGVAVARSPDDSAPAIGTDVVDESLATVGEIVDVFGPVECPYLAVSPTEEVRLASLVGATLYARNE